MHKFKNKLIALAAVVIGLHVIDPSGYAQTVNSPVQYVRVCSLYGTGFHYIPGTDICINDFNGDTRQQTEGGTWRSLLPYPEGEWVTNEQQSCAPGGKLMKVGTFKSTDFTPNAWNRKQTAPVDFPLN